MTTLFVTASGTEVGKTFVMTRLIGELARSGYRVRALKPVASGFDPERPEQSDTGILLRAQGLALTTENIERVTPWRFVAPLSPDMAARREYRTIEFNALVEFSRAATDAHVTLIEGVGGVMVPVDERHTVRDWIAALGAPALLVTGSYLGSLSHTLTAAAALDAVRCNIAGVIVSESISQPVAATETASVLERFLAPVPVCVLPRVSAPAAEAPPLIGLVEPLLRAR